jgi:NADPH:quinone reductase-like Zn-dependent oxidoreductase
MSRIEPNQAQVIYSFGDAEEFRPADLPLTAPAAGEVQIRVAATAVNNVDLLTRAGYVLPPQAASFPMVLGWDLAGTIEATGEGVQGWRVGDRVAAMTPQPAEQTGTYARRLNLAADLLARVPDGLELERAATIPLAGLTASQTLDWVDLSPGQTLLVNAPLGSVGRLLVQLASRAGLHVVGAVRPDDGERATAFGAAELVDRDDLETEIRRRHPGGVDAAVDLVGRPGTVASALAAVRDGGAFATIARDFDSPPYTLEPERGIRVEFLLVHPDTPTLGELLKAAARGELTTAIEETYPLAQAADAHRRQGKGRLRGKLILVP